MLRYAVAGDAALELCRRAIRLNLRIERIARANDDEIERVGRLRRPALRWRFIAGTGRTPEEWIADAAEMTRRLDRALAADRVSVAELHPAALVAYGARLRRLAAFNQEREVDARQRYLDAETLDLVLEALRERRQTAIELAEATEALAAEIEETRAISAGRR